MQLDLFDEQPEDTHAEVEQHTHHRDIPYDAKECCDCGETKPLTEFPKHKLTWDGTLKRCKDCLSKRSAQKTQILKTAPPPPEDKKCECCGVIVFKESMHFDECHATATFRGWLCRACNQGIGMLGDNKTGILNALAYLERHEDGLRAAEEANTVTPKDKLQERYN